MTHPELLRLVEAHEKLERELLASGLSIWKVLADAEPQFAKEILALFPSTEAAAKWTASPQRRLGTSPARLAAEGRAEAAAQSVLRALHGLI